MSNLSEMQNLVGFLRKTDRIPDEGVAVVQIALGLAEAVDSDPQNASLWREYRQAEVALRELGRAEGSDLDDLIAALQASVPDGADGPSDVGSAVGGDS